MAAAEMKNRDYISENACSGSFWGRLLRTRYQIVKIQNGDYRNEKPFSSVSQDIKTVEKQIFNI